MVSFLTLTSFFFICFFIHGSSAVDTISGDFTLSGDQTIVSSDGTYEMGFFKPGSSSNFYIGMWYKQLSQTILWVANRDKAVSDKNSSVFKISNGNLILLDGNYQTPVWSTGLNSTSSVSALEAVLQDDGNLVLRTGGSSLSANVLWQSFDHPGDTWLPGVKIRLDKRTGKSQRLTSWKSLEDPSPGLFSLELDESTAYKILWNGSNEYWSSGPWNPQSRIFDSVPEMRLNYIYNFSFFSNTTDSYFTYSIYNQLNVSRFVMDVSGQIKQFTWLEGNKAWNLFWSQPRQQCQVYRYCGSFGICSDKSEPFCRCPQGFRPMSQKDWDLKDYSAGCVRKTELQCSRGDINQFFRLPNMKLADNSEVLTRTSLSICASACQGDCSCKAYAYDEGSSKCLVWSKDVLNLQQLEDENSEGNIFYLRLAASDVPNVGASGKSNNKGLIFGAVLGSLGVIVLVLLVVILILRYRRRKRMRGEKGDGTLSAFSYRELQNATKNFSDKLGGGGFGSVFKGALPDSSDIAVKRLEGISQGEKQFRTEVVTIGTIQHVNLVRLRGFCSEGSKKLLVYDYMPNGSLDSHLFLNQVEEKIVLGWKLRFQIALGTARGLAYLHDECRDCIIHCDIKPENILLDSQFCPKVADFGLAKLVGRDFSRVLTTMRGTRGYLAPEWISGVAITAKADVYSYGMMLFELVSGRRNTEQSENEKVRFFPSWAATILTKDGDIRSLVDPRLEGDAVDIEEVTRACKVACWCIQDEESHRPAMSQVVQILEGVFRTSIFVVLSLVIILNGQSGFLPRAGAESKVHIVYLGEKQHDDPEFVTESHHRMLWSLLGSKEEAHGSMVHSFRHGFSGFAAKLTESQAKKIADLPEVVHVIPDRFYKPATTRTWDYLGLSPTNPKNLLNQTNMGEQMIIGIIDSGVWPESEVFNDNEIGPVPSHWKGGCESGEDFNSSHCNKKLIGAKYFINAFLATHESFNSSESLDFISPRGYNGHGTHVATIAGGSYVPNTSYKGLAGGTVRGGAPRARIAVYKTCWYLDLDIAACSSADILKAMDEAIHDGVDVLSLSLGFEPLYPETDVRDGIATGAFHAVLKGITVVCAAGNAGPAAQTVGNTAPWILTVAATTLDRSFVTPMTLGNNKVILGQAIYTGTEVGFTSLVYPENPGNSNESFSGTCERLLINSNRTMAGKVVLCFTESPYSISVTRAAHYVKRAGGLGVIIAGQPGNVLRPCLDDFPCVAVDYELGTYILFYIRSNGSPVVKIQPSRTLIGQPVGTKVASFSSRGPNPISAAILKPDIAAPGVSILAATTTNTTFNDRGFIFLSGTSMATPTISGIVALLKALHPDWSPAAIRSAIVTTAWRTDPFGEQIFAEGSPRKPADPFDYGGGLVNPEKATKPGLVYDLGLEDYVLYMCSVGYNETSISQLVGKGTVCSYPKPSVLDFNLPSITIPNLKEEVTLPRTLTNVGPLESVYRVAVEPPLGTQVTVTPETLVFNSTTKRVSFKVSVSTTHKINTGYYFGSLTWSDSLHNVTIPLSVRTQLLPYYYDEN